MGFYPSIVAYIPTVFQHCLRAFLLLSNTLCVHFYLFLCILFIYCLHVLEIKPCTIFRFSSSVFASSSLKTKLLKQFLPPLGAGSLPVTSVWSKSKPITATKEVKPFYYVYSNQRSETFTFCLMMIKLLLHFLLHFGSNSFKIKRHGPIRNLFDKMAPDFKTSWRDLYDEICSIGPNIERIMSPGGYVSCLNRTKNAIERVQTLPTRSHKKSSSKAILFGSDLGGQKGVISLSSA